MDGAMLVEKVVTKKLINLSHHSKTNIDDAKKHKV